MDRQSPKNPTHIHSPDSNKERDRKKNRTSLNVVTTINMIHLISMPIQIVRILTPPYDYERWRSSTHLLRERWLTSRSVWSRTNGTATILLILIDGQFWLWIFGAHSRSRNALKWMFESLLSSNQHCANLPEASSSSRTNLRMIWLNQTTVSDLGGRLRSLTKITSESRMRSFSNRSIILRLTSS